MMKTSFNVRRDSEDVPKTSSNVHRDPEDVQKTSFNVRRDSEDVPNTSAARNFGPGGNRVAEHESEVDQSISIDIIDFLRMALKWRETSALGVIEVAEHESDVGSIDPSRLT
ncbi:unnamed protein product [Heligmosomoides polygyrus]|uniref:Uncharacterized protein n=1 Tax=Heligmosomoides polygyrus TaxID=6339 RepID=A0A183GC72_HELPZ|nr:unnamed protein product [Heligmosomoides polygyrus]